jgi:hypothetical protein
MLYNCLSYISDPRMWVLIPYLSFFFLLLGISSEIWLLEACPHLDEKHCHEWEGRPQDYIGLGRSDEDAWKGGGGVLGMRTTWVWRM